MSVTTAPEWIRQRREPGWLVRLFDYKPFLVLACLLPAVGLLLLAREVPTLAGYEVQQLLGGEHPTAPIAMSDRGVIAHLLRLGFGLLLLFRAPSVVRSQLGPGDSPVATNEPTAP